MLKKLSSPQLSDVYQPARDQFNGRGSFGNGGAMRAAPFALAFPEMADVKRVSSGHPLGQKDMPCTCMLKLCPFYLMPCIKQGNCEECTAHTVLAMHLCMFLHLCVICNW